MYLKWRVLQLVTSTIMCVLLGSTVVLPNVGMGWDQIGVLYLRYIGATSRYRKQRAAKHLYTSTLYYSNVEGAPRLPLAFLKLAKIVHKISVLFFSSFFLSFSSRITQKLYGIYKCSTYETNVILLKTLLFWYRAVYEL